MLKGHVTPAQSHPSSVGGDEPQHDTSHVTQSGRPKSGVGMFRDVIRVIRVIPVIRVNRVNRVIRFSVGVMSNPGVGLVV